MKAIALALLLSASVAYGAAGIVLTPEEAQALKAGIDTLKLKLIEARNEAERWRKLYEKEKGVCT